MVHSLWIQYFRLSDIFSFIIVSTVAFVTILNPIVSRRLFRADVSTQFNCHVVVTCYGITIKNSSIIGEIHDTYSVSYNRVNAHGPGASTDLFEITTATAITLARPCPFKSIFGFVTRIALHWPFKTSKLEFFRSANGQTFLNCHFWKIKVLLRKWPNKATKVQKKQNKINSPLSVSE